MSARWRIGGIVVTAICLYVLFPTLTSVYESLRVQPLDVWWVLLSVTCDVLAFSCVWRLQRVVLRADFVTVAGSQLAGNAVSLIVPGGAAAGAAVQYRLLAAGGVDSARAASGLTASSLLTTASLFVLPLLALPAVLTDPTVEPRLAHAVWLGVIMFALLSVATAVIVGSDRVVRGIGNTLQKIINRFRHRKTENLAQRLLHERAEIIAELGSRWATSVLAVSGRSMLDFLALMCALAAVGSRPNPALVLMAYAAAAVAGMIPLTPGGVGFVEASLTATLALAGVSAGDALVATAVYRLVSFFLPMIVGLVAYPLMMRRGRRRAAAGPPPP
jgi:hypothetical protein